MSLYHLEKIAPDPETSEWQYSVGLNPNHAVFKGHFPGQPVLPGVIQMELLGKAIELESGKKAALENAKNIKFLKIIDPIIATDLLLKITVLESSENSMRVSAVIDSSEGAYFKFRGTFKLSD